MSGDLMNRYPITEYHTVITLEISVITLKPVATTTVLCSAASRDRFSNVDVTITITAMMQINRKRCMMLTPLVVGLSHLISEG